MFETQNNWNNEDFSIVLVFVYTFKDIYLVFKVNIDIYTRIYFIMCTENVNNDLMNGFKIVFIHVPCCFHRIIQIAVAAVNYVLSCCT